MEQFDIIEAIFKPKRTDDLKPGVDTQIGRQCLWQASWLVEKGEYKDDWAMMPVSVPDVPLPNFPYFLWVPLCDLEIIEKGKN